MSTSSDPTSAEPPFGRVAILGLGVMGGSLARALSGLGRGPDVAGWSPSEAERVAATEARALTRAPSRWEEAVADADLVVLAAPLRASCELLADVARVAPADATLTDVASLKSPVARAAAAAGLEERWVGSHPMTGSEESGFAASRADLYRGAHVWTTAAAAAAVRVGSVHAFWRSLGASPAEIEPEAHDRLVATASHLPQLVANALASVLANEGVRPEHLGPGGRDMTRLAGSSAEMWRDLLEHASPELVRGLRSLAEISERLADLAEAGDLDALEELMRSTATWRRGP